MQLLKTTALATMLAATLATAATAGAQMPGNTKQAQVTAVSRAVAVNKVHPQYPPRAKAVRLDGTVRLLASVSRQGVVRNVRVVEGHPLLAGAAVDALRQWRFRPATVDGLATESSVTVDFAFSHSRNALESSGRGF